MRLLYALTLALAYLLGHLTSPGIPPTVGEGVPVAEYERVRQENDWMWSELRAQWESNRVLLELLNE
jgi:hypothetical protein